MSPDAKTEDGAYTADRAAALSGVPKSTVHYWARNRILVPAVSEEKVKLWSWFDLFRLRAIYWLRQPKTLAEGREIPASAMSKVRRAIAELNHQNLDLLDFNGSTRLRVAEDGHVFLIDAAGQTFDGSGRGQAVLPFLDLIAPFETPGGGGLLGPDLVCPRPRLRIVPRKLSGSPHVAETRVETKALAALARRGFAAEQILELYPFLDGGAVEQSLDLESQLTKNMAA